MFRKGPQLIENCFNRPFHSTIEALLYEMIYSGRQGVNAGVTIGIVSSKAPDFAAMTFHDALRELRKLTVIAVPLAGAYLAGIAMGITDIIIVGRLGHVELAAVALAGSVAYEVVIVFMAIVSIVGVFVAQADEKDDAVAAADTASQGLWVATILSVVGTIFCFNLAPILAQTGQDPDVIDLGEQYLHLVAWFFLPTMLFTVLRNFLAALARARSVMVITISAVGLNIFLTYSLVFGEFGLPELGVAGAGLSTALTAWAMFFALAAHVHFNPHFKSYRIARRLSTIRMDIWKEIMRLGLPAAGITMIESGMYVVVPILMGILGTAALAASEIAFVSIAAVEVVAMAIGEATMILVAQATVSGGGQRIRVAGFVGLSIGAVIMMVAGVILFVASDSIVVLFLNPQDVNNAVVIEITVTFLTLAAVFQLFNGAQGIAQRALRGIKDTLMPMWLAAIAFWILGFPLAYYLAFPIGLGGAGIWYAITLGAIVLAVFLTFRFWSLTCSPYRVYHPT